MENEDVGKLRAVYSEMTDGELLALAVNTSSLTETARYVLADELRRRGLEKTEVGESRQPEGRHERDLWVALKRGKRSLIWNPIFALAILYLGWRYVLPQFSIIPADKAGLIASGLLVSYLVAYYIISSVMIGRIERRRKKARRERAEQSRAQHT